MRRAGRGQGVDRRAGRPHGLTAGVADRLVFAAELGGSLEPTARSAGVDARTLRRWRARGRRELDALPAKARLVLELSQVMGASVKEIDRTYGHFVLDTEG